MELVYNIPAMPIYIGETKKFKSAVFGAKKAIHIRMEQPSLNKEQCVKFASQRRDSTKDRGTICVLVCKFVTPPGALSE